MNIQLRPKKLAVGLVLTFLFLVSVAVGYFYFTFSRVVEEPDSEKSLSPIGGTFDLSPFPTPTIQANYYNVLLLGYGGEGHSGGRLSDSIVVAHVDTEKKIVAFVSIPRDLWIALPAEGNIKINKKINSAFAVGGSDLAKKAVSTVIGMPIHLFVAVSFDGLKEAIDILGGVEVGVPKTFDDHWFPVKGRENDVCGKTAEEIEAVVATMSGFAGEREFPCRYEHIHFDKGVQQMNGEVALKFVRSRHSSEHGGDFARSQRQQALLLGIRDKLFSLGALDDAIPFFNQLSHTIQTDFGEEAIKIILDAVGDESAYRYLTIRLTEQNVLDLTTSGDGQSILIPKEGEGAWGNIHAYISGELDKGEKQ